MARPMLAPMGPLNRSSRRSHGEERREPRYPRLKNCTARSWASAALRVRNVPRFRRLPVLGLRFREYRRYSPDLSLRIMVLLAPLDARLRTQEAQIRKLGKPHRKTDARFF